MGGGVAMIDSDEHLLARSGPVRLAVRPLRDGSAATPTSGRDDA